MSLDLRPVQVAAGGRDTEGRLVFHDGFLVGVLVHLSDDHGDQVGRWFLEVGLGRLDRAQQPLFADLDEARDWITRRLGGSIGACDVSRRPSPRAGRPIRTSKAAPDPSHDSLERQRVLAVFGALALRSLDLDEVLANACRLVGDALHTGLAMVLELQGDGLTLRVRAGVGWKPGIVGHVTVKAGGGWSERCGLGTGTPVTSDDVDAEGRFTCPAFLRDDGVRAFVNVVIGADGEPPYGVLEVDSRTARRFTGADIAFLQSYASLVAAAVDRFRMMGELRGAVSEKDRLLRELQHRIKNNLQVITAFVGVQSRRTGSPEVKAELEAIGNRIETLRLVHDKLYTAGELERVDLAPYLSELSGALVTFHGPAAAGIRIRADLARVCVTPEIAVPLGLIVNEFVTNSIKHAFAHGRGIVGIDLVTDREGPPCLTLWDDGRGFEAKPSGGTGMRLVNGLLDQLGAKARWNGDGGARLTVVLPREAILG